MWKGGSMTVEVHEMITYVKMKNFMSFKDVMFDFRNGSKGAKKFISIMVKMVAESLILLHALIC